ncbi:SYNE2 isoform 6 [Pongo abelii]|uniref:Nesprin-2 n=1 Tax=Pongo abelii TaxID=9601 RepID=A0A2J8WLQ6_PONAB|nr:SYNE2 isoform 6 [Pongo abelii]
MASSPELPTEDEQGSWGIDNLHISLQAEQEDTQKKAFTCWINSQLARHTSPSVISDLFTDIKKGHVLLDLLEVLSGQQLPRDKGSNTFQCRINIEHALTFLRNRSIKLINIHVTDIIDGNPSIILGLIWTIILHFHIEKLAQTLSCNYNQPSLDDVSVVDSSPASSPPAKKCSKVQARWQMSAKKALLLWAQEQCATYESVNVTDFKSSWRNGMAFLAIIHALRPDLIDMKNVKHRSNKDNLREAFRIAERELKIPRLLEPEDVDVVDPDEKSIMTYVAQFLQYSKDAPGTGEEARGKVKDAMVWLTLQKDRLQKLLKDSENDTYFKKYNSLLSFMESFNEEKKSFLDVLSIKQDPDELDKDHLQLREAWDGLDHQINAWKIKLNYALPPPLHQTEAWLQEVEELMDEDLSASQDHSQAVTLIQEKMTLFKSLMDRFEHHSNILLTFENKDENHLPLVPPNKLEEMKRRINNILEKKFILLLEFHYYKCLVLGLVDEVKSKLDIWNIKYGSRESVELLLEDWHKFIEEKEFLARLDTSFQKCGEVYKNLAGECENISKQYMMVKSDVCMYRKKIYNVKSTLQKVLACWATYVENLRLLRACFEETKKEEIKEVPFETLAQWNLEHATLNEAGNFLVEVSNDVVGSSISKELRRLNKRWRKLVSKTQLEMNLPLMIKKQDQPTFDNSGNILSKEEKATVEFSTDMSIELPENYQNIKAGEKHEKENEEFTGQLKVAKDVEKLIGQVEIWEAEAKSVLDQDDVDTSVEESLKEALIISNTKSLAKYLKAVEELKNNVTEDIKMSLEEKSRDVCAKWEAMEPTMKFSLASELKPPQEESIMEKDYSASINSLLERYDTYRDILEHYLQNNEFRITSGFSSEEDRSSSCLQAKLTDLQNIQDSIAKQIEICNHLEEPGNFVLKELHPFDLHAMQNIILKYKTQFEEMNHKVQRSEDTLKALEDFLASLRTPKFSAEPITDLSASDTQVTQENTLTIKNKEGEIHLMKDKAKHLDKCLKMLDMSFKDAEWGEDTSCENLLDAFSIKLSETHGYGVQEEFTEENKLLEACIFKNNELLKNIQDVQSQISKIGLKDPTVPAVKHRLEQCGRVLELLKQYQNFKSILTTLIQKEESVISLQASYMGKENLKKRIAEIEIVKEEFNEHLEVVDKINQICKNLQFYLNKMKTFEEPPFEKEANIIVDRWLDINEKTEDYYENLGRALALWDKLFNLKNVIDEWTEKALQKMELHQLTEEDREKLKDFLSLEGRNSKIKQVDSVLKHVKKHLPKAHVKELTSWLVGQEFELEKMESICQARAKELEDSLEQLLRLRDDHRNLSKWLTNQEEKWKGMEESGEKTELFCQALARKREQFESVAQLNNSLKEYGFTEEEEIIMESTCLMGRYQTLLRQLSEIEEEDKLPPTEDQSFNDLAHDVIHWIKEIKESLMVLNSSEGKMPLEERIQKIKEIILLKPEGDARIETIMKQAESSEAPLIQKTLADISNQWDNTLHLASTYLSHQEKLLLEGEKYLQSKEDLRLMLIELKKKQEAGFALQHGLQEKKAQLKIYKKFLKKAQDLTSLLKELKSQGNYLLECTKNPSFSEEPWLEIKHLHESLLQQLQDSVQNLEGHVREHDSYQVCITDLNTTLDNFSKEFVSFSDKAVDQIAVEEKLQKLQELENRLSLQDGTLKKILALAKSVKQNTSSVGQKIIKDDIKSLKCKQKDLENSLESAKQEMECCLNSILKSKCSTEKKEKFTLPGREKQATSDVQESTQESAAVEKLEEDWEINKDSAVEMVMSKQLSLNAQESMKNTEDEQKVNELQNQPLELDTMLRNEQLEEIEKLYTQLEAKKAAIKPLEQTECLNKTETGALVLHNIGYSAQHLDSLLQALITLKKNKESQCCLLRDFQEYLAAVESSMKALLTDKESLKVGPLDSVMYLDKIKKFIASIEKEKDSLGNLKIKWENLSNHVTDMDKKLLESQIKQLEHDWEQVEQQIQKKYSQQVVEYDEFTTLMNKVQDTEISLQQQQQHLQLRLKSPEEQAGNQSMIALTTDLQATKHGFSVLKGQAELQMKRIWGEKEKKNLEDGINNLKKQWETLEPLHLEAENQIKKCDIRNKMKNTILWAKNLLGELNPSIPLLPDDILSQIRKCKVTHDGILARQQSVESLAEEVKDKVPSLTTYEGGDLNNTLEDLRNQYQMLVLKSTQRSQQLEFKLEERSNFFAIIRKFQLMVQKSETLIIPRVETTATEAELKHHHVTLEASQKELQEIDSGISTHLQELTNIYEELNVFERLFLDDQLKNLKIRTNRIQRFIQNKCNEVEHKIKFCRQFHEKTSALQEEVDNIQRNELLLNQEVNKGVKEEIYNLKDRLTAIKCCILQVLKLKKVFDYIGLNWDFSQLDRLQTQVFEKEKELEEKIKQLDTFEEEHGKYQALLSKMRAVDLQIKKMTEVVLKAPDSSPESRLLNAQILSQRIEKAKCLCDEIIKKLNENKAFDDSFKEKEILQIKLNAEENDKLYKVLQNMVLELSPKELDEKNFQDKLETSLHVLNQIKSQLQQPLLINLEIKHIQNEKDNCEAFQEQVWAEMCSIKAVNAIEKQREENSSEVSDVETKLREFEDLQMQLNTSIDLRTNVLNDAYENLTRYKEAVTRAVESITSLEAIIIPYRVDVGNPEESLEMPLRKQEELESTVAHIQDLTEKLGMISSPEAKLQLQCTLQELVSKNSAMKEAFKAQETEAERYLENYKCYRKIEEDIYTNLSKMETVLGQSMSSLPLSYREALEGLEQSKALVSNLLSTKEELMKLRHILRLLRLRCTENDGICLLKIVSALWEKWLSLLEAAKEWEMWCEELKQEWKFVSEEIEREAIILDNLQEELPEISKTKEAATTEELSELLDCLCQYGENVEKQQLLLTLLFQRIRSIQNVPESSGAVKTVPAFQEITSMQERCNKLLQKVQKNKELVQTEIQERHSFTKEIIALKNFFQQTTTSFQNMAFQDHPEKSEQFEELQSILKKGKLTFENIMEKLRIKYSEMYTIVPAEIESQVEECRKALEDIDEKISNEVLKSSPSYAMRRKIEEINNGLHNVEKMLQQKSKNIEKAQEIQKKMWDELDLWHSKLNELDSEVQDIVEQDPGQAQEWMDNLMIPFQQYQQVSQRAESRTSQLNKATVKMEEYSDLLKSTEAWIENTSHLLANPADYDSSRTLSHHASTLQDVVAIESEVKSMEKRVSKIKAILLSKEIFDFSPEEHLKHGEVILENIRPMKKTIAEILSYQVELRLPQTGMKPLPVFQRANQLLQDIKLLENVTQEQNELLKVVIKQTNECDEEIENLKQILNNYSAQFSLEHMSPDQADKLPQLQGEVERMEKQILSLNQRKEDLLVDLKATVLNLHQHLKQEQEEVERDRLPAVTSEEGGVAERDASERKLNRRGSMSYLAAVKEEVEESSMKSEEAYGKISTCDNSMAQILTPDSLNTEQGPECSLRPNHTEEGTTPRIEAATLDSSDAQGGLETRVEKTRPEPTEVLHACKTQVAELELWLQQANVAVEPETLNADMQQVVEQQLVGCQVRLRSQSSWFASPPIICQDWAMLTEIEHKVAFLLETCKDQGLGDNGATQHEAEALSLKLKTVKCNLEKVQMMLQEKHSEDQHPTILKKSSEPEHQEALQPVNLSELESIVTERPQFSRQKDFQQQQVSTNMGILPSVSMYNFRYPTTEELKTYTTQLEDLRQEASNLQTQENMTEEAYINLDKKLFELFLTLSQCLSSVEEMLEMPRLYREDGSGQQVHYETLALELKKLYLALSDKKGDLLKAMTWSGKNTNLLLECFDNLQVCLEHTQAAAVCRSKSLKAGLDYNRSYQKADAYTVELENAESRVAKLRDEGERLHLPYALLQEVYKLEDVLDSMWGMLRARYTELSSPFISESQQDALLQGVVELVKIGKEKLAHGHLKQTKSKVALQAQIENHQEFSKEVDEKSSLKTAVISTGNQLLHLKETDTATLRASLAQFEQKWTMLITQLPDIQEKLHQLQMEKLPSRKAITEMISWMNNVEHQTSDEDSVHSPSSASQVKRLLQKHKEFRMEMDYKQWIVDFVNQSLLQLSTCDVESKRYERTEFAEHLGEMNRQWHRVHGMLNRKIQHLEQLLESITESENKIQILNNWMEAQEERLKILQKPESVISVQKLLLDCQDIENQLAIKSKALDELKQSYLTLESGAVPLLEDTASRIDELFQKRSSVLTQVNQLKTSMQSVLQEWKIYDQLYDEVNMMTIRFWYCMEHSKPVVLSLEALRCQVENLQSLQDEAESSEGSWEKLQEVIGKLKGLCPSVAEIIEEKCQNIHKRWTQVNQAIADQLQKAQSLLQLWKAYSNAHGEAAARLKQQEAKFQQLANISMSGNNLAEILPPALQDIKELQHDVQKTKEAFLQNSSVLDRLPQPEESSTHMLLPSPLHSLQRAAYLEKMLLVKANEFEFVLSQFKDFGDRLESLKGLIMHEEENLDRLHQQEKENPDSFLNHVLALTAQSPDIEHLNEVSLKLPLSDIAVKTLQNMNRQWIRATATALERCSELQGIGLNEKFLYCCEKWIQLLEKIEEALKVDMANSLPELLEQQKTYEMLEAEVSINQTIADSYVTQSLQLLDTTEIENRPEFISEFSKLTDRWQNAVQRVRQRKGDVDGLVRQWQDFTTSVENLFRFLTDTSHLLSAVKGQERFSLYQTRSLIHELKNKEIHFQRWQTTYALTLEAGEKLLLTTDLKTKESVGRRISQLQDSWKDTESQLAEMIKQFQSTVETWDQCEKKIKELKSRLQVLKAQSEDPLPELHEDLHNKKELIKELEQSLASWTQNLKELQTMKADLTRHILMEDVMVLKEQIEHLHRQWEDLCLRVAIHKQEIEDRLNTWVVFNEKNKELCAWLVQMENKVLQTADISIEEMIEKLQKDCMEEINLFSENKLQLKQMGDQLIKASNKSRAAEIDEKLNKINDRWQHLFDVIGSRVKKLKETFAFIQQLDKNMSNLRTWLARIESELSKPVVYDVCDDQEIQKRLAEQQDLQRDIEQHSAGVESVFNICDVLLHDSDACANETECDSIQQTTRSLDRRWRNICAMSMERRMKIEETWRLWQKFLDDYSRFEDWLKSAERTAACPNSSEVLYTSAKEELKRFEAFQRQIHERLTQLELINKQYRRLARENRTDTASRLKQMVHEGNQRWDNLQRRVTAVLRRLRHFTNQREEFEGTRESILVWLTEMDLQLTNVEHFSESDADDKMRQLNGFQQEITLNTNKIDQLIVFGEQLIQKSEPLDAVLIEDELEELHRYCQEVFGRVSRFHRRLTSCTPGLEDEKEASENETDMEDAREIQTNSWRKRAESEEPSSPQSLCHLVAPGHERSGCETPVSVDSIPLEWDHTGDVGGSSSHEEDEEGPYYSALSGKSISDGHSWHVPDSPSCPEHHYKQMEGDRNVPPVPPASSTPYKPPYGKLLLPPGTDGGKEGPRVLNGSPQQEDGGLAGITEQQSGAFDRWELIQAQELHNKLKIKQNLQQLNSDISAITTWLKKTEAELEMLKMAKPPSDIQEIEVRVKRLQEILKAFDTYKALVVSVNVSSKEFLQTESPESTELQSRLRQLSLLWEAARSAVDSWRGGLRQSLMQCQDFHQLSQNLLLWLASAENRRQKAHVTDPKVDPQALLECRRELMQLEEELVERQPQVDMLQEISNSLLIKGHGEDYIEAEEKVHVIEKKLKQLQEQVSQDLMALQGTQNPAPPLPSFDEVDSGDQPPATSVPAPQAKFRAVRTAEGEEETESRVPGSTRPQRSFLSRVIRAALPLQLLLLLLLLLACLLPSSEDDYSCTQANNFARSFYPMLRYTNGPPPT